MIQLGKYHLLKQCCTLILSCRLYNYAGSNTNLYGRVKLDKNHPYLNGRNLKRTWLMDKKHHKSSPGLLWMCSRCRRVPISNCKCNLFKTIYVGAILLH